MQRKAIEVDEDLPNFFQTIKPNQANQMIQEAANMKQQYSIEIIEQPVLRRLGNMQWPNKSM